jgi:FKBP-type peptidyl-prolyl cis-trans isomerase FkpA
LNVRNAVCLLIFLVLQSCGDENPARPVHRKPANDKALKEQFMRANQALMQKESDELDAYARSHKFPVVSTTSGIKYFVYRPSQKGDSIKPGMQIRMTYTVSLLDGTVCYSSDTEGKRSFEVEHANVESGIHRGVQYLKKGDAAILLVPSYLAHGLLGDMNKIPPQSPVIYNIQID